MGSVNLDNTGSGSAITLSSDGTSLLLDGTAIGGGGADLYAANESSPSAQPSATGTNAIAIGDSAVASGTRSTALGYLSNASASGSVALGMGRSSGGASFSAVIDNEFSGGALNAGSIAIGNTARANASYATAIGRNTISTALYSIAIGYNSTASHNYSIALGENITSTAAYQINIGGTTQDVRISETYTLPKVDGTNGQVLTTDGSGAVTFADAGGGADLYAANESSPSAQPSATGANAIAIGELAVASGGRSVALGRDAVASAGYSTAIGTGASGNGAHATGNGSVSIGEAYSSGVESTAISISTTSTSYGASGSNSIAMGELTKSTGSNASALGGENNIASGSRAVTIGGHNNTADGYYSSAKGYYGNTNGIRLKHATGLDATKQGAYYVLGYNTTDATPIALNTSVWTPSATNQITLQNNSAIAFSGTIVAREKASEGTDVGAWEIKGIIRREANAGTTVLVNSVINELNVPTGWAVALTADTTLGCLKVAVTGVASTNIRWVATIQTSEVIYA